MEQMVLKVLVPEAWYLQEDPGDIQRTGSGETSSVPAETEQTSALVPAETNLGRRVGGGLGLLAETAPINSGAEAYRQLLSALPVRTAENTSNPIGESVGLASETSTTIFISVRQDDQLIQTISEESVEIVSGVMNPPSSAAGSGSSNNTVPEPGTFFLLAIGALGALLRSRKTAQV